MIDNTPILHPVYNKKHNVCLSGCTMLICTKCSFRRARIFCLPILQRDAYAHHHSDADHDTDAYANRTPARYAYANGIHVGGREDGGRLLNYNVGPRKLRSLTVKVVHIKIPQPNFGNCLHIEASLKSPQLSHMRKTCMFLTPSNVLKNANLNQPHGLEISSSMSVEEIDNGHKRKNYKFCNRTQTI